MSMTMIVTTTGDIMIGRIATTITGMTMKTGRGTGIGKIGITTQWTGIGRVSVTGNLIGDGGTIIRIPPSFKSTFVDEATPD